MKNKIITCYPLDEKEKAELRLAAIQAQLKGKAEVEALLEPAAEKPLPERKPAAKHARQHAPAAGNLIMQPGGENTVSSASEQKEKSTSAGGAAKIAVVVAAIAACVAIGMIAALKIKKKPEEFRQGSSEILLEEISSAETSTTETTATTETRIEKDKETTSETTSETTTTSERTEATAASTSAAPFTTTVPRVTFSIPNAAQSFIFGQDGSGYSYRWKDENDHSLGLQSVTWTIVVKGAVQDYVYIKVWKVNETLYGEIYDPKGVFARHENEKMALKLNVEPILDEILNLRQSELGDPSFRITKIRSLYAAESNPISNHWVSEYYTDWVQEAQLKALNDANDFLRVYVLGK
ncbi:MAG: hypothetical protein IJ060_12215 [Oscillospiraceae bacterium]|nr:hypothetical protein [Oscillospiraceae bacterium]